MRFWASGRPGVNDFLDKVEMRHERVVARVEASRKLRELHNLQVAYGYAAQACERLLI